MINAQVELDYSKYLFFSEGKQQSDFEPLNSTSSKLQSSRWFHKPKSSWVFSLKFPISKKSLFSLWLFFNFSPPTPSPLSFLPLGRWPANPRQPFKLAVLAPADAAGDLLPARGAVGCGHDFICREESLGKRQRRGATVSIFKHCLSHCSEGCQESKCWGKLLSPLPGPLRW